MQFNGIGSEHDHHMHQITNCMHEHGHYKKDVGQMPWAASQAGNAQTVQQAGQDGQLSLSAWMDRLLGAGRRLLRGIWGSNETAAPGEAGSQSGTAQVLAQMRDDSVSESIRTSLSSQNHHQSDASLTPHTSQIAAAASAVPAEPPRSVAYYAAAQDVGKVQETLWQKVRVKFKNIAGQLAGHLPGKFFDLQARNSFGAKQERPKEEIRRQAKPRRDRVEIGSIQVEESYLLDSYDRKGEYSRLSAKK